MVKMTGGQALAKSLYREGVRVIFGLPGVQIYHMMDGLYDEPGIRFITVRHEQATAYMADGYARAGGQVGTAMMVPGPGLLNASSGISTAYSASSPVLVVSGQIERDEIGGDRGMLHEVNDQLDAIAPVKASRTRTNMAMTAVPDTDTIKMARKVLRRSASPCSPRRCFCSWSIRTWCRANRRISSHTSRCCLPGNPCAQDRSPSR